MQIEPYNSERRVAIAATQDRLRLILPPERVVDRMQISGYLDQETRDMKRTMDRLGVLLFPYQLACHSALGDIVDRQDELLYSEKPKRPYSPTEVVILRAIIPIFIFFGNSLQELYNPRIGLIRYIMEGQTPDYSTFVSMRYQEKERPSAEKGVPDRIEYLCLSATFAEGPTSAAKDASDPLFLSPSYDSTSPWIRFIPRPASYAVRINFGLSGEVKQVISLDTDKSSFTMYGFSEDKFSVHRQSRGYPNQEVAFQYLDGKFQYPSASEGRIQPIEGHVEKALSRLPFTPFVNEYVQEDNSLI